MAPDLPPVPGAHPTIARDHEYKRHGTVTLMAGIDLLTGQVHALVRDRHRRREFIEFLGVLDMAYPAATAIKAIGCRQSLRAYFSEKPRLWLAARPGRALPVRLHPQARIVAQPRRGLLLPKPPAPDSVTSASPPSTSSTHSRIHRRPQPRPGDPSMALSNRRCRLIHRSGNLERLY